MTTHKFTLSIEGTQQEAVQKAQALTVLSTKLDTKTLLALAKVVQNEPMKVAMAKKFLGI